MSRNGRVTALWVKPKCAGNGESWVVPRKECLSSRVVGMRGFCFSYPFWEDQSSMQIIDNLAKQPGLCIVLCIVLFFVVYGDNYILLTALLKMHRSKTAVKKLNKQYNLAQKLWFIHFYEHCLHAVGFCKAFIWYSRMHVLYLGIFLLSVLLYAVQLFNGNTIVWLSTTMIFLFSLPSTFISWSVSRPFIGRFKIHTFEKYHNTDDHSSLF